jgi:hypothetical protein
VSYSFLDKLLFRIFLGNNIFQEVLFDVDKLFFYKKRKKINSLIITGLPRSGTTILLNELYKTKKFSSLTFQDLPFILSPNIFNFLKKYLKIFLLINLWEKFIKKNKKRKYKRIHNDGIFVVDEMPEAFDEVFWRVFQNRKYINKNNISMHSIDEYEMSEYQKYVNIITYRENKNLYITKNNNNILRLNSFKNLKHTFFIITFRDPFFQSYSLIKTHKILCKNQKKNTFILSYMDYLVHHEFGLNLKTLKFKKNFSTKYKNTNINFWLAYWVYVYENVLKNYKPSKNIQFLAYEKFNTKLTLILKKFNLNFSFSEKNIFQNKNNLDNLKNLKFDNKLKIKANQIYRELKKL